MSIKSLILVLLAALAAAACRETGLDEMLARNTAARGGSEAFARIENVRFVLAIREPGFEVTGTYVATRKGSMRIDIEADGQRVFSEGLADGRAWQWTPDAGVQSSSAAGAEALRNSIEAPGRFYTLEQARERGLAMELVEPGTPEEWQLQVTLPGGRSSDYFIDRETFLTTREVTRRAFHPDVDPTETVVENRYGGPAWVDGVLRFTRVDNTDLDSGAWLGTTIVRSVEHNIEIPEGYFQAE